MNIHVLLNLTILYSILGSSICGLYEEDAVQENLSAGTLTTVTTISDYTDCEKGSKLSEINNIIIEKVLVYCTTSDSGVRTDFYNITKTNEKRSGLTIHNLRYTAQYKKGRSTFEGIGYINDRVCGESRVEIRAEMAPDNELACIEKDLTSSQSEASNFKILEGPCKCDCWGRVRTTYNPPVKKIGDLLGK